MLIDALSQLVGYVCASGALAFVALLAAAWFRRWAEGLGARAAEAGEVD